MLDLVIRGGSVFDGRGGEPFTADVGIVGERITHVGPHAPPGAEEIDARGMIVTPGFVDLHTHYDAQATWDSILAPSAWHGVTSLVMGNCGVGFAPVRADARSWLIEIMENVEEIPRAVLESGLTWDWNTFPEYLDALDRRQHTVDIGAQLPHIAVRAYVMGDRAVRNEAASAADIVSMTELVQEAISAGALGLSCSHTVVHALADGSLVPGSCADRNELLALGDGLRRAGGGQVQFLGDGVNWSDDLAFMLEMSRRSNAPVHFTMTDTNWRARLEAIERAGETGARLVGHVAPRAIGNVLQWRSSRHPFMDRPSIRGLAELPWPEQLLRLRDRRFRERVLEESNGSAEARLPEYARVVYRGFGQMYEIGDSPNYEPDPKTDSIAARALAAGQTPESYAYDVMMRNNGEGMIYMTVANYQAGDFSELRSLIRHPGTLVSLSDAGAHCTRIVDATAPTFMLTHWARDRSRGERLALPEVVRRYSLDPAAAYGLHDRGVLAPGYLGDANVIDFDRLRLLPPYMSFDFPTGGRRLMQAAEGYVATIKRGRVTFRHGAHTGALPGRLIRGNHRLSPEVQRAS